MGARSKYGLPIVAAQVGGPKEILISERTGLFSEPKNATSLAAQVIRLIRDPELRLRTAAAPRRPWTAIVHSPWVGQ